MYSRTGPSKGVPPRRELAVDLIRQYQRLETHPFLRAEFSIIEGEEEFIPYPSRQKLVQAEAGHGAIRRAMEF